MNYLTTIDGEKFKGFSGFSETNLHMYVHKGQYMKEIKFIPIHKPFVVFENGEGAYITQEHINTLLDYEKKKATKEFVQRFINNLEELRDEID